MRSVTTFLFESSWDRDFSCLSINSRRSNISGGGEHYSVKELDMGLQFITVCITLPVQVNHDGCFLNSWYKFFMLLDQIIQLISFSFLLILGTLSHQNFQNLSQPFLYLSSLQVLAK